MRDRLVQRSLLRHLETDRRFRPSSSISYGFTKERTLSEAQRTALQLRNSSPWMLKCDIVRFFDRIPRERVKAVIRRNVGWKVVAKLLCQAVDCELQLRTEDDAQFVIDNGIQAGIGLRQGMPVSPMLSNLLLRRFDDGLVKQGIIAVRYADDIAIFTKSREDCLSALAAVREGLSALELDVPALDDEGKTSIHSPSDAVEFLGVEIRRAETGYKLCAPIKKLEKIEAAMGALASVKSCVEQRRNIGQVVRSLDSFVVGHAASMAVLEDGGAFLLRLEAAKRRQLHALLVEVFGKAVVSRLDPDHRAILGVEPFPAPADHLPGRSTARFRPSQ